MRQNGLFITFEGVEGAGKTTQIGRLARALTHWDRNVLVTREPGGHRLGEEIRHILLNSPTAPSMRTELLLFLAARAELTESVIRPHLDRGGVVICDRYIDSTMAYQGYARGPAAAPGAVEAWLERVRELNDFATGRLKPDVTLVLDLDPTVGLTRQKDHNRMEAEDLAFHRRVRAGYLAEAERDPARFRVIDASRSHDDVFREIRSAIDAFVPGDHP